MSRRVYVHNFLDIDTNHQTIESVKDLTESEWQVKENQHNINMLNKRCVAYDFLVKEADAKEDTLNLRSKK